MNLKSTACIFFFLFFAGIRSIACDYCGCFMGITPYDNQSSISLNYRYKGYNGYESMDQSHSLVPGGLLRTSQPQDGIQHNEEPGAELSPNEYETYRTIELRAKYFVHPHIELNLFLPYRFSRHVHPEDGEDMQLNGPGDMHVLAGYHVISQVEKTVQQRLIAGAGVKIPTGIYSLEENGKRLPAEMQPGTGSFDGLAYANYILGYKKFGCDLMGMYRFNGENNFQEKISPTVSGQAGFFYRLRKKDWFLAPSIQTYYENTKGMQVHGELMEDTGSRLFAAGPGFDAWYKNVGLSFLFEVPVSQQVAADAMSNTSRIVVSLSWNFNQASFPFGK